MRKSKRLSRPASRHSVRRNHEQASAPSQEPVVVTAADDAYAMPLAAMGRSLIDNLGPKGFLRLYVLDAGMRSASKRKVIASWDLDRVKLEWLRPRTSRLKRLFVTRRFGQVVYYRVLIPSILPPSVERAIYLDADTLVLDDVNKLWQTNLRGRPLAAVCDPVYATLAQALSNHHEIAVSPQSKYFNSGVLLLDLKRWRAEGIAEEVIAYAEGHPQNLRFPDQDALNFVLAGRWLELSLRWNMALNFVWASRHGASLRAKKEHEAIVARPGILHFIVGPKPWQPGAFFHRRFLFFHYLDRTQWAGWRPRTMTPPKQRLRSSRSR